jgi:pimeloyl-ACP methyl ester carboxylesterase
VAFSFISNTIIRRIAPRLAHRIARLLVLGLAAAILAVAASAQTSANNSGDDKLAETKTGMNGAVPNTGQSKVKLEPCEIPSLKITAQCGKYEVYEDREAKSGRKIALNILVLPALTANPKPDPIFYFEGGPGGSAVATAKGPTFKGVLDKWRTERDIIFVDQRGTGDSNPLRCDLPDPDDMTQYFSAENGLDRMGQIGACRDRLAKVANLTLYTTPIAMDDLDEVRQAMGYDKINLFGGSYGTRAALVYIRQHGDHVRSAVLDGVAPTNFKLPLPFSKGVQNALERLFTDCAADPACHKAFPDVEADLKSSLSRFDHGPITVTAFNTIKKQPQTITMTRGAFMDLVRLMLYDPSAASLLPLVLHQSAQGEFGGIATIGFLAAHQVASIIANGMSLSVICAEDAPFISDADIKQATDGTFYGDSRARALLVSCKQWPRGKIPAGYSDPVQSDVPVLIISGDVDPVTPPWVAADAATHLSHSRQIVGKSWSHSSISQCGNQLMADFISKGTADGLDAACMQDRKRPVFNTGEVAMAPKDHAAGTVKTSYEGTLDAGAQKFRLVLNLFKAPDGKLTASLDSPDQGMDGLAIDVVSLNDHAVHFEMKQLGISYDGNLKEDGSEIDGTFKQGAEIPLNLKKKQ